MVFFLSLFPFEGFCDCSYHVNAVITFGPIIITVFNFFYLCFCNFFLIIVVIRVSVKKMSTNYRKMTEQNIQTEEVKCLSLRFGAFANSWFKISFLTAVIPTPRVDAPMATPDAAVSL